MRQLMVHGAVVFGAIQAAKAACLGNPRRQNKTGAFLPVSLHVMVSIIASP
jgi:hypothetical protein